MHVEIILCTPVGKKLNGAADALFSLLNEAGITDRRVVDRNDAGYAQVRADIPLDLIHKIQGLQEVISVRATGSRA